LRHYLPSQLVILTDSLPERVGCWRKTINKELRAQLKNKTTPPQLTFDLVAIVWQTRTERVSEVIVFIH
jgi:hypothetical protein